MTAPDNPGRLHLLRHNWRAIARPTQVRALFTCSHRWPDGSSAWGPCAWELKGYWSTCQRCGVRARCR